MKNAHYMGQVVNLMAWHTQRSLYMPSSNQSIRIMSDGHQMLRCRLVTDIDGVSEHKEAWEMLRHRSGGSVFTSPDLLTSWMEVFSEDIEPRILMVSDADELIGVAPFMIVKKRVHGIKVRTLSFLGEVAGSSRLGFCHYGILIEPERPEVLDLIISNMNDLDWNSLWFHYLDDFSYNMRFSTGRSRDGTVITSRTNHPYAVI